MDQLGYTFTDLQLLKRACTHRSYSQDNNERLEFLGDSLVNFIVGAELYKRYPEAPEGQLTRLRAALVCQETLAAVARDLELHHYLIVGPGERKMQGQERDSVLSDALEAIIGAIYLDGGITVCTQQVLRWYGDRMESKAFRQWQKDPKTTLQEWCQKAKIALPHYEVISKYGKAHEQMFTVVCTVEGLDTAFTGVSMSKKLAEQAAAQKTLDYLQV